MTDTVNVPREEYERIIGVAEGLIRELSDPGTEAMAAVWCARRILDEAAHALAAAPKAEPVSDPYKLDLEVIAKDASERVHKNGGCVPQMAYAPILFALQDAFKAKPLSDPQQFDGEDAAWAWVNGRVECDPGDIDYSADEMVDAFMAGQASRRDQPEAPKVEQEPCKDCNGTGMDAGSRFNRCPTCHPAPSSAELPNLWWNVEDWEETFDNIEDAYDAATGGEMRGVACLGHAIEQTRKYAVRVDIDTTGDGDADDYEIRTFDSRKAAEQQIAKHKGPQS